MSKKPNKKKSSQPVHTPEGPLHKGESFKPEQYAKINNFLSRLQLGDLCFSDVIDYGIALLGQTKAGKTTLAHHLVNNPLVVQMHQSEARPAYVLDNSLKTNKLSEAVIGMTHQSQTVIPNSCEVEEIKENNKKVVLLDCPGYSDSKGSFLVITNAYFHYRVFSKVRNLKFVLTIDANYLTETYQRPVRSIQNFLKAFKNLKHIKEDIFNSTVILFTKISQRLAKHIEEHLEILKKKAAKEMGNTSKEDSIIVTEMMDSIIKGKRFYCFKQAQAQNIDKKVIGNDLLKTINNNTKFWSRPLSQNPNQVDMSYIRSGIGKEIKTETSKSFKDQFRVLCGVSAERFEKAFIQGKFNSKQSLSNILMTFLNNSLTGKPEEKEFATKYISQARQKFYIYGELRQEKESKARQYHKKRNKVKEHIQMFPDVKIDQISVEWIQKLQISKLLIELLQNNYSIEGDKERRTLKFFNQKSTQILKVISQLKKINFYELKSIEYKNYESLMDDYCYIIYRLLEQAKVFKIIFHEEGEPNKKQEEGTNEYYLNFTDMTLILVDMLVELNHETTETSHKIDPNIFERIKAEYVSDLEVKQNESRNYYNQIEKYCKTIDPAFHTEKFKQNLSEISRAKTNSKGFNIDTNSKISSIISRIRNIKSNMKSSNNIKNQEVYIDDMNQLADVLREYTKDPESPQKSKAGQSDISNAQVQKHLKCAIKIYKIVNNVYMTIETYKTLITKYNQTKESLQLKQILQEFADYCAKHGRKELAIESLQRAYHLIDIIYKQLREDYSLKRFEREKIAQKIGFTGIEKRHDPSDKYYDQMLTKKYFGIISEKELNELEEELALK